MVTVFVDVLYIVFGIVPMLFIAVYIIVVIFRSWFEVLYMYVSVPFSALRRSTITGEIIRRTSSGPMYRGANLAFTASAFLDSVYPFFQTLSPSLGLHSRRRR